MGISRDLTLFFPIKPASETCPNLQQRENAFSTQEGRRICHPPANLLRLFAYCCGAGAGAPCPPSRFCLRSCICACIASYFVFWSSVNTARILSCDA
jgi:hypothetical protein